MIRAILTGRIRRDYAEHRHPLWIAEMAGPPAQVVPEQEAPAQETAPPEKTGDENP
ncbi:MAG: hypothetical protein MUD15_12760 [Desulfobacterota bacterium]|nr:hypothetical protein [Thermodesulfobacteriota bacterium]